MAGASAGVDVNPLLPEPLAPNDEGGTGRRFGLGAPGSRDGLTLVGVSNSATSAVGGETRFEFEQDGDRLYAHYAGGAVFDGPDEVAVDDNRWDARYVQVDGTTATGRSTGRITRLAAGRLPVAAERERDSRSGSGESVLEEVPNDA